MKKINILLILLLFPFVVNAADRLSCDYKVATKDENNKINTSANLGNVTVSIGEDFKLNIVGSGNAASNTYKLDSSFPQYTVYLNSTTGDLECASVKELYVANSGTKNYLVCYSQSACNRGAGAGKIVLSLIGNNTTTTTTPIDDTQQDTTQNNDNSNNNTNTNTNVTPTNDGTCNEASGLGPSLIFIGHIIRIAKILIPLVIIVMGIMDFFKAMTAGKDDEIKKVSKSFVWRLVSGVIIFFLPSIISLVFGWIPEWAGYEGSYQQCFKCVWDVGSCLK